MSNISSLLSRRFSDLSLMHSQNEISQQQQSQRSTILSIQTGIEEGSAIVGQDQNESIAWYPASDFFSLDSYSYSFSMPKVDPVKTNGNAFCQTVEALTRQLELHIKQASLLVSRNDKIPLFSEGVEELLRVAIGRSQLLLDKRMKQFREQLNRHMNPIAGQKITKLNDLHGLWALIDMQLEDIQACFDKIEKCRLNNWSELPVASDTIM